MRTPIHLTSVACGLVLLVVMLAPASARAQVPCGTFADSGQALGVESTVAIVVGDLDGDGDLDFVEGNYYVNVGGWQNAANRVYLNDGNGLFADSGQMLGAGGPEGTNALALGDLDGDGDLDLVEGLNNNVPNRIWWNDGSGTFSDSGQGLGSLTSGVALGDLDGDGDLDLVEGWYWNWANRVYWNDGSGVFTNSGQSLGSGNTSSVALGDLDGDGDLDCVEGCGGDEPNRVYLNDGSGTFTESGQALGVSQTNSIELGDLDGDGDLDLATGNGDGAGQANRVYWNDGGGNFTDSGQQLGTWFTFSARLGDVDGDYDLDLVTGNHDGTGTRI